MLMKFKIFLFRWTAWMGFVNFGNIILLVLGIQGTLFSYIFLGVSIFISFIITLYDYFYIMPREQKFYLDINKTWEIEIRKLSDKIDKLNSGQK
jgi:hypothetical protein